MSIEATDAIGLPVFKSEPYTPVLPMTGETDTFVAEINKDGYVDMVQVVEEALQEPVDLTKPKPNPVDFVKRPKQSRRQEDPDKYPTKDFVSHSRPKPKRQLQEDPDKYLMQAKALVVQNYNDHRDPKRSPVLNMDLVFVSWFSKTFLNWKAVVGSTVVRGLLWEVSFNGVEDEKGQTAAYIDVYQKLKHIRIPLG